LVNKSQLHSKILKKNSYFLLDSKKKYEAGEREFNVLARGWAWHGLFLLYAVKECAAKKSGILSLQISVEPH